MFRQILALLALPGPAVAGPDLAVLEAVRTLALTFGAEGGRVHLLHVVERNRSLFSPSGRAPASTPEGLAEALRALQADGIDVVAIAAAGRLTEEVERVVHEHKIDLVVVGRPGRGWGDHGLRVVRLSDAPVLVMPEGTTLRRGKAVIGMDFSHNALRAYAVARALFESTQPVAIVDPEGEQTDTETLRAQVQATWVSVAGPDPSPLQIEASPTPTEALLGAAHDADLLAVGSRGLTPLAAVLLGSTAEKLGARSTTPLLIYRDPGTHKGLLGSLFGGAG